MATHDTTAATAASGGADSTELARFGYRQELERSLGSFFARPVPVTPTDEGR